MNIAGGGNFTPGLSAFVIGSSDLDTSLLELGAGLSELDDALFSIVVLVVIGAYEPISVHIFAKVTTL